MKSVRLDHITKRFGATAAVNDVQFQINKGELFFLLGPSGCGKSTLLRMIAGLISPTAGKIYFDERDVTRLRTSRRNAVMCFQSYALWPHLSVRENIRFGLAVRKLDRGMQDEKIDRVLHKVQMAEMGNRKPNSLSGGQQQRVALARALAVEPDCLLLDEPLSNLDAKLRLEMRTEIRSICKSAGLTTIYVTHDQKEALSIADRIAVMDKGSVVQIGTPGDLYHRPKTSFVADFIGQTNLLEGKVIRRDKDKLHVQTSAGLLLAAANGSAPDQVIISIRPEQMRVVREGAAGSIHANRLRGRVLQSTFLGEGSEHLIRINEQTMKVISTPPIFDPPAEMTVEFDPRDAVALAEQMLRYILFIFLIVLIVAPLIVREFLTAATHFAPSTTVQETLRLRVITANNQDIRNEFRWAFSDWHRQKYGQAVELEYLTPGGTNDILRQLDTQYRAIRAHHGGQLPAEGDVDNGGINLVWGGGDYFFNNQLKPLGILRPIDLDPRLIVEAFPQPALAGVRLYDYAKDKSGNLIAPEWVGSCLSSFGIVYNPDLYGSLGLKAPAAWGDLTNPKLFGSVALADPTHSGSAAVAYMMIMQRAMADAENVFFDRPENKEADRAGLKKTAAYREAIAGGWKNGMRELLLIAANARYFSDSSTQVPNDVAAGDAAAGMAIDFYGRVTEQIVGRQRCRFVDLPAATAITPDPVAILYGTTGEQLVLANHFIEFLLSREGQRLWILKVGEPGGPRERELHRPPVRRDVYDNRAGWSDDVDYFRQAGDFNQRGEWMAQMPDLRPIWTAAWIDDRDDLLKAYGHILSVKDAARRQKLIDELSDLPVTMGAVNDLIAERKKIEAGQTVDPDLWKAENRMEWAAKFRDHYRAVASEVGR